MFSITLSSFEEIYEFLHMLGVVTIFGEGSFMFNFVGNGLVKKSFGARCTFEDVMGKKKFVKR
jgi:hypothetical protein